MATGTAAPRNRGNRRSGQARGTKGGQARGTLAWQEDPEILRRVELVADLYHQPRTQALAALNLWLEQNKLEKVSIQTLDADRKRAKELLRERVSQGMEAHLERLQEILEDAWRTLRRTPDRHGQARAALYAVIIRCIEDMAKLDGTWGAPPALPPGGEMDEASFGPSPQELVERGDISREDLRAYLLVTYQQTGGRLSTLAQQSAGRRGAESDVIDGVAMTVPEGPPAAPRAARGRTVRRGGSGSQPPPPPPSYPRQADEPEVVDWNPDEE